MRIGAASREIARDKGARFPSPGYDYVTPGYDYVTRDTWLCRFHYCALPAGVYLWYKTHDALWRLGIHSTSVMIAPPAFKRAGGA